MGTKQVGRRFGVWVVLPGRVKGEKRSVFGRDAEEARALVEGFYRGRGMTVKVLKVKRD